MVGETRRPCEGCCQILARTTHAMKKDTAGKAYFSLQVMPYLTVLLFYFI